MEPQMRAELGMGRKMGHHGIPGIPGRKREGFRLRGEVTTAGETEWGGLAGSLVKGGVWMGAPFLDSLRVFGAF